MQGMHKKRENHCSRDGVQGIKDDTNLSLHDLRTLSLQDRIIAEVKKFTKMIDPVPSPIFDPTLQLVDGGSVVFFLYSLIRSG